MTPGSLIFFEFEKLPKNLESRYHNGLSNLPKFTFKYHPTLKIIFLCDGAKTAKFELV